MGLGPGGADSVTIGTWDRLKSAAKLLVRTGEHPAAEELVAAGVRFETFDFLYEKCEDFQEIYREIASSVIKAAISGPVVYAVPGHPLVGEESVRQVISLAGETGITWEVMPAMSFLDPVQTSLGLDISTGLKLLDGLGLAGPAINPAYRPDPLVPNLVMQVYNHRVASEVKLSLMEYYPDEHTIKVIRAAGIPGQEKIAEIPLFELDRLDWIDHLTCVYLPPHRDAKAMVSRFPADPLVDIMERLRDVGGCPWDREQTHESLKKYLVEETYETLEAIDEGNMYKVCEELGDLLLQVAFHAQIAREDGSFDMNDIIEGISRKLVRRHPHVFGGVKVNGSAEVSANWDEIKKGELEEKGEVRQSLLDGIPLSLPALMKADKIQHKAAKVGFDWPDYNGALSKVFEEIAELQEALARGEQKSIFHETGDLIFAVVNLARLLKVNSEEALEATIRKFRERFIYMEKRALQIGVNLQKMDLTELDKLWEEAKVSLEGKKNDGF
ncbi:MAG: nucleoside triphosphate pyrophosphohydrolase [Thermincola sp.]|nr:nucleoside triphosphate pyrophosphohydrolase [Thermincola sp.]MDT3702124.1 nucleoside triphosphate pyrophosphohydrolase [Thermincola sp.]